MIKIAQLINKWVSMIFLSLFIYPKIMKIVLPLSYHVMSLHKNFDYSKGLGYRYDLGNELDVST